MNTLSMPNDKKKKSHKIIEQADMRPLYFTTALLFVVILCPTSCTQVEVLEPQNENTSFNIVGEPVRAHLSIAVGGLYFGVETRAEEPVPGYDGEDSEAERRVDDLWLFEYSSASGELIYPPQRLEVSSQEELADMEVTLSNNYGKPVTIYVVANSGSGVAENSANWVVSETFGDDITYPGFMTIEELEATTIPTPHPQRMTLTDGEYVLDSQDAGSVSIPMSGHVEATVKEGSELPVPVARMFAKVLVRVDLSEFSTEEYRSVWLNTVTVGNIPEYCTVGALGSSTTVVPADYSACPRWVRRSFNAVDERGSGSSGGSSGDGDDEAVYPYLIYVPENIQGENRADVSGSKADNVPNSHALSVTAGIYVETISGATLGEYSSFVVYPGGNSTDNFNVRRNCLYRVTLKINNLTDDVLPSANCIVCLSGETTAFWPYCRTETGGGYKFTDHLDAFSDDASKRIARVGIIWQSTDGGNTVDYSDTATGYIGDNSNNDYVWIDEVGVDVVDEYHRRIHVKIPEGRTGNAVIGAYNSDGEIVWSWHIWSRAAENDPRTVNIKLYYTYDWDGDGIYGKDSGRPRVAGYTIMNSNLGAMQDEPSGSIYATSADGSAGFENARPTFGTLYQWGRKDPFPPIRKFVSDTDWGGPYSTGNNGTGPIDEYDFDAVGNYFDNGNHAVSIVGTNTSSALFHSVPGAERKEFDEMLPLSIQNPTVFYAGTNDVNQLDVHYERHNLADNLPEPKDGNWILDGDSDHFNRLWGGLDPEQDMDQITKSYDTGLRCTLGDVSGIPIHIYDDYGEKSIFDPCPYGWRVSPPDLWLGFTGTGLNAGNLNNANYNTDNTVSCFSGMAVYLTAWREGETSFFPCQGTRAPDGCALRVGQCGNYSNATADANDRVNILHLHDSGPYFNIFENEYMDFYIKSTANPLRCIRMDSVQK